MSNASYRVAVIGGGIIGVTLAHELSKAGHEVTVYERSDTLGGLAGYILYDGVRINRFYHTILTSDMSMQSLIQESGIADKLHFTATQQGFYDEGKVHAFNTPLDFALFEPLNPVQRFRLGLQIIAAQLDGNESRLNNTPVKDWLLRVSGRGVYEKVWRPLLRAKFDTMEADVPATYIWSRIRRMMGTREGITSKEMMCYLENSYFTLIEALAAGCEERGVTFRLETAVDEVVIQDGRAVGIRTAGAVQPFDAVVSTLQSPLLGRLSPDAPESFLQRLMAQEYLGVVCPLVILKRRLTPYYVLNITDTSIPFTAVVETTNLIDPAHVKGHYLVYLPKFLAPDSEILEWSDERVEAEWLKHLKRMFPDFDEADITDFLVQRARYVEPLHPVGTADHILPIKTPVERLYMANTAMVYPELNNGESGTRLAARASAVILEDAQTWMPIVEATPQQQR